MEEEQKKNNEKTKKGKAKKGKAKKGKAKKGKVFGDPVMILDEYSVKSICPPEPIL